MTVHKFFAGIFSNSHPTLCQSFRQSFVDRLIGDLHIYTVSQKKFPPLNSLYLCHILTDFQNLCIAGKRMKLATKSIGHYPPHLKHVATLPWEIKNSTFLQIFSRYAKMQTDCISLPLTLLFIHKFFMSLFFYLFTFAINLYHRKFVTAYIAAVFFNNQHGIQRRVQGFDK